jgi:hypothetical protein
MQRESNVKSSPLQTGVDLYMGRQGSPCLQKPGKLQAFNVKVLEWQALDRVVGVTMVITEKTDALMVVFFMKEMLYKVHNMTLIIAVRVSMHSVHE